MPGEAPVISAVWRRLVWRVPIAGPGYRGRKRKACGGAYWGARRGRALPVNPEPGTMAGEVSEGPPRDLGHADRSVPVLALPEKTVPNGARAGQLTKAAAGRPGGGGQCSPGVSVARDYFSGSYLNETFTLAR
jgi:hypothetical protein